MLKKLKVLGFKNIKFLTKGKRGLVYTANYRKKRVAIKLKNKKSLAKDRIQNEIEFLKILNKYKIGPKLILTNKNFFVYEFIKGKEFVDLIKKRKNTSLIIKKILKKCRKLDELKINKKEFTRPNKHILIKNNNPYFIDFERCYFTDKPKNVTQFCQFLIKKKLIKNNKKILQRYKADQNEKNFKEILKLIKSP